MKWNNYLRWKDSDIWLHENFDRLNIMNLNTCRTHIFMWTDKIQDPDSGYDVIQSFKVFNQLNIIKHRILTWCGQSEGKVTWWFGLERNTGWGLTPKRGLKRFPRPPPQPVYLSGSSGLEPPVLPKIRCGQGEKRATSWSTRQPESQKSRTLTFSDQREFSCCCIVFLSFCEQYFSAPEKNYFSKLVTTGKIGRWPFLIGVCCCSIRKLFQRNVIFVQIYRSLQQKISFL